MKGIDYYRYPSPFPLSLVLGKNIPFESTRNKLFLIYVFRSKKLKIYYNLLAEQGA